MESRWSESDAPSALLDLRIYGSRLLGVEPSLVQWGGGNTSVKLREVDYRGEEVDVLRVKASGSDLKTIEGKHFAGLRQVDLDRLRDVPTLADEVMVDYLNHALLNSSDARPSIETLLHGFMPYRWVDHTHADAIVAVTNQPNGIEATVRVFGTRVVVVPWVRPGFDLAKAVFAQWEADRSVEGVVLVNHGLTTFADEARESYERTVSLVSTAEEFIADARGGAKRFAGVGTTQPARSRVAAAAVGIRGAFPFPVVLEHDASPDVLAFVADARNLTAARRGPATPDHALRIKGWPASVTLGADADEEVVRQATREAVAAYAEDYRAYVARYSTESGAVFQVSTSDRVSRNR